MATSFMSRPSFMGLLEEIPMKEKKDSESAEKNSSLVVSHLHEIQTGCLIILAVLALGIIIVYLRPVLVPFLLAYALSDVLLPVVRFFSKPPARCFDSKTYPKLVYYLKKINIPWWLSVFLSIIFMVMVAFITGIVITMSISDFLDHWNDGYAQRAASIVDGVFQWAADIGVVNGTTNGTQSYVVDIQSFIPLKTLVMSLVTEFLSVSTDAFMVVLFAIFLLLGSKKTATHKSSHIISPQGSEVSNIDMMNQAGGDSDSDSELGVEASISEQVGLYIRWKALISIATGFFTALFLSLLGVELALVFGFLAFLFNFIPNVGSLIALLLPLPVVIFSPHLSTVNAVFAILLPGLVHTTFGNVIEPLLLGKKLNLKEIVVLLSLIFWGCLWGVIGLFLAVPLTSVLVIIIKALSKKTNHPFFNYVVLMAENESSAIVTPAPRPQQ